MLIGNSKFLNLFVLFFRWKGNTIVLLKDFAGEGGHISIKIILEPKGAHGTVFVSAPMTVRCRVLISSVLLRCVQTPLLF